ncbi:MAG TPA: hypothetical protein VIX14_08330 [Terriglobales bacterium]
MRADDLAVLLDCCEGRGKFSEIDAYMGIEGPNRTMLLPDYVLSLNGESQQGLLDGLVKGALGQIPELERYIGLLVRPLMMLAISGHSDSVRFAHASLEEEYVGDQNVQTWLRAVDNEALPNGAEFKKTWHYALVLGRILHAVDSAAACSTIVFLREHAVSQSLRAQ